MKYIFLFSALFIANDAIYRGKQVCESFAAKYKKKDLFLFENLRIKHAVNKSNRPHRLENSRIKQKTY